MSRVLAIDLGASSGRAMLAEYKDGKITIEELHRFSNDPVKVNGTLYWDTLRLFYEIKRGITAAVVKGGFDSIGIDTWGVDFGLIGADGDLVGNPVHYRDSRTDGYAGLDISVDEMYNSTGIQVMQINTIYQLDYLVKHKKKQLEDAEKLLFTPDLLNYFLCGEMKAEYTIASTSQMLDARKRDWDYDLIKKAGVPEELLCEVVHPGTICGYLRDEICEELNAPKAAVICIGSHDTASAVASVPTQEDDFIYISSGTWSLLGTETAEPVITPKSQKYNFTNEGGVNHTIRFLKNIMGTWIIQECRRQWIREGSEYSFGELETMAKECEPFKCLIDVDAEQFGKPGNMPQLIKDFCKRTNQYVPQTPGEIIRCVDESLALKYRYTIECIKDCTENDYATVNIVGGGTKSRLLNQMTADASGLKVITGPEEATVYGNACIQLMAKGELKDLKEIRRVIENSCTLNTYEPKDTKKWDEVYKNWTKDIIKAK